MMASIVFVGTEGCGKTVLITVLSKLYGPTSEKGLSLTPLTYETAEYVERAWQALKKSEWPPSTPPGKRSRLEWQCRIANGSATTLRLVDSPGQDLRQVFANTTQKAQEDLPEALQELAELVQAADVVVFLVNLRDFWGEGDPLKRLNNEWLLRGAMDHRTRHRLSAPMCLVFTQADLYADELRNADIRKLAAEYLPNVAGIYFVDERVPIFVVSAVGKTIIATDETGRPRRVPDGKLHCKGFSAWTDWLIGTVSGPPRAHYSTESVPPPAPPETAVATAQGSDSELDANLSYGIVIAVVFVFILVCCGFGSCRPGGTPSSAVPQQGQHRTEHAIGQDVPRCETDL